MMMRPRSERHGSIASPELRPDRSRLGRNTQCVNAEHVFLCGLVLSEIADVQVVLSCYAKYNPQNLLQMQPGDVTWPSHTALFSFFQLLDGLSASVLRLPVDVRGDR